MFLDQDRKTEQLFDRLIHADIGYVKKGLGHYVENTGETDLMYMEVFRAERFEEVSLSDWLAHSPVDLVPKL